MQQLDISTCRETVVRDYDITAMNQT